MTLLSPTDHLDSDLIPARRVRQHFGGCSDMWLFRRLRDDPTFPRPIVISRRRYWRWSEIRIWEAQHVR
jgi:predicted DNA-binding transcriptional regulator AlpA